MEKKITAITVQKRNPQRVNIHLDGEFAFGLARIVAAWLAVGQSLSEEKISALRSEDEHEVAYAQALNYLSYRPRSETEVRRNLLRHETPEAQIERIVVRLKEAGLLNDQAFAQTWVENRNEMRPRSRRMLAHELRQRGLDAQAIDESLSEVDDDALAYQAASAHARKLRDLEWADFRKKMYAFLARRGFSYEASSPAVAQVWAEQKHKQENEGDR